MTSRAYQKSEQLIRRLAEMGFTDKVGKKQLHKLIKLEHGGDPRTLRNWTANLRDFGFIEVVNPFVFRIRLGRVEGALEIAVKNGSQKKLM